MSKTTTNLNSADSVDILLVTFNRLNFLKTTVKAIYHRTRWPHRLWVVDNASTDGTARWLKKAKLHGYLYDYILANENKGLATGFSAGFKKVKSDYFICTQDDIVPPDLKPCWLERMLHLMKKYEDDYAAISMRVQRIRHRDVDEHIELIESPTSLASVFRIQKKNDIEAIGGFGARPHWESTGFMNRAKKLKKKLAVATKLYADHIGFMSDNKGFEEGFIDYHTYSKERIYQGKDQPYSDIDSKTNMPLKINSYRDRDEQGRRDAYYKYWGMDKRRSTRLIEDQKLLGEFAKTGKGVEIGCGKNKSHPNVIGVDIFPFKSVDVVHSGDDLWMFKDEELDFVIASHSLEHFPDTKVVLREWKRVLKLGGIIAVAVPNGELRPGVIRDPHKCIFTKEVLRILFKFDLNMRVEKIMDVPNKRKGHESIIVMARKK